MSERAISDGIQRIVEEMGCLALVIVACAMCSTCFVVEKLGEVEDAIKASAPSAPPEQQP